MNEKYYYKHVQPFKNINEWQLGGAIQDASFLIDLAHIKGHPICGFGGGFQEPGPGLHDDPDAQRHARLVPLRPVLVPRALPRTRPTGRRSSLRAHTAPSSRTRSNPDGLHLHIENCNQCGRCLQVAPAGSWKIDPANF